MLDKPQIRQIALEKRNRLTSVEVAEKSKLILQLLEAHPRFQTAENILFYYSHQSEVYTHQALERWVKIKSIFLPRLTSKNTFEAVLCDDLKSLQPNVFGILEPPVIESPTSSSFDLIVVPGVAFDSKGRRVGMGKGYYDRFLAQEKTAYRIGLAFDMQIFDELPEAPYDERVNLIITEKKIIRCSRD